MAKKSYVDKLKNPLWQRKRLEILNRDKFSCRLCKDKETELHIHHLKYGKEPWLVPNESLATLCKDCHMIVESGKVNNGLPYENILGILKSKPIKGTDFRTFIIKHTGGVVLVSIVKESKNVIWLGKQYMPKILKFMRS